MLYAEKWYNCPGNIVENNISLTVGMMKNITGPMIVNVSHGNCLFHLEAPLHFVKKVVRTD